MGVPSVVKYRKKTGTWEYTSKVDIANYTMRQLTRRALQDVGKVMASYCNKEAQKLRGLKNLDMRITKPQNKAAFQYWVRGRENDLQIGPKHNTWYGVAQELGWPTIGGIGSGKKGVPGKKGAVSKPAIQPRREILFKTVTGNIPKIVEIEALYLSYMNDEAAALNAIRDVPEGEILNE